MIKGYSRVFSRLLPLLAIAVPVAVQAQQTVATSSSSAIWKNSPGECWQAADGSPAWCGDIPDSDGDGVPDDKDLCPDTPAGSVVGEDGCLLDTDRDGVPDVTDQCPDTALGVRVDTRGCDLDLDGDGVPYYADRCWDTPKGTPVDERGCPGAVFPADVLFEFDRAVLTMEARKILNQLVRSLNNVSDLTRIQVTGHTDSVGAAAYNLKLSQARAMAVKSFLEYRGIRAPIAAVGKGESEPVADNGTAAGRAKNRRVEIVFE